MMLSLPEIILVLVIILLVFGTGKLGSIGQTVARIRLNFNKGLGQDVVDITAMQSQGPARRGDGQPRPGTRSPGIDDAEIDDAGGSNHGP